MALAFVGLVASPAQAAAGTVKGVVRIQTADSGRLAAAGEVVVHYAVPGETGFRPQTTTTNSIGEWTLTGLTVSEVYIYLEYVGTEGDLSKWWGQYSSDTVPRSPVSTDGIVRIGEFLYRPATLSGTALLEDGIVASAGELTVSYSSFHNGAWTGFGNQQTVGADGSYAYEDLSDGSYKLRIEYSGDGEWLPEWYFDSPDVAGATIQHIQGASITTDLVMPAIEPSLLATISGVVTGAGAGPIGAGIPVSEFTAGNVAVTVQVWDSSSGEWVETPYGEEVAADGTYTLDELPPGDYRAQASYSGEHGEASVRSTVLELDEGESATFSAELRPYLRDVSGDGIPDVLGRGVTGNLVMYKGNPNGTLGTSSVIGTGWNMYNAMVQAGDVDLDGDADLIARDTTGRVWLHPGAAAGGLEPGTQIASGWKAYTYVLSPGDVNGDGFPDMMTLDTAGKLWLHPGNGFGALGTRVQVSSGWSGPTAFVTPGDFDVDGYPDLIVRDRSGLLWLYRGTSAGTFSNARTKIGTGWQNATAIFSVGDFDGDGNPDLLGRGKTGSLYSYAGSGAGTLGPAELLNAGWQKATFVY